MYQNQYDTSGNCSKVGFDAEQLFEQWLIDKKKNYRKATLQEQYDHIDFILYSKDGKSFSIDIKGPKKTSRSDSSFNNNILWVEFVNVRGYKGSLYGKNDYIGFYKEDERSFYIVKTRELASLCEKLCNNGFVCNAHNALYHKYSRQGRKDVISMIQFDDIKKCRYYKVTLK